MVDVEWVKLNQMEQLEELGEMNKRELVAVQEEMFDFLQFKEVVDGRLATFPDLVGYYEFDGANNDDAKILRPFLEKFDDSLASYSLHSSLTEFSGNLEFMTDANKQDLGQLETNGWLSYGKSLDETNSLFSSTCASEITKSQLECVCRCVFSGFVFGYVFLYWPMEKLVVYPHEKGGFGFVAGKATFGYELASSFLKSLDPTEFEVGFAE